MNCSRHSIRYSLKHSPAVYSRKYNLHSQSKTTKQEDQHNLVLGSLGVKGECVYVGMMMQDDTDPSCVMSFVNTLLSQHRPLCYDIPLSTTASKQAITVLHCLGFKQHPHTYKYHINMDVPQ